MKIFRVDSYATENLHIFLIFTSDLEAFDRI